jgi:hypothetical protein
MIHQCRQKFVFLLSFDNYYLCCVLYNGFKVFLNSHFKFWFNFLRFSTWSLQNHLNCDKKVESFYSVNYVNVNYSVKYSTAEIFTFSIRFFSLDYNQNSIKIPNITVKKTHLETHTNYLSNHLTRNP